MKVYERHIVELAYTFLWCVFLMGAAFPSIFTEENSFSFLSSYSDDVTMNGITKAYVFSMTMIVVLHLLDVLYVVILNNFPYFNIKREFINTLLSVIFIAIFMIWIASADKHCTRIVFFVLFWIVLFFYKFTSLKISVQQVKRKNLILVEF